MLKFLFKKQQPQNLPEFWKQYEKETAALNLKKPLSEIPFVAFDTETTGIKPKKDKILSIGAIKILDNIVYTNEHLELFVTQTQFDKDAVKVHGILKNGKENHLDEEEAIKLLLDFIKGTVLIGHHVGFDVAMINYALRRLNLPKLTNKLIDTGALFKKTIHQVNIVNHEKLHGLDELCEELKIPQEDRHKAAGDAYITAIAFLKIKSRLKKQGKLNVKMLFS